MIKIALIEDNVQYRETFVKVMQRSKDIVVIHQLNDCGEMTPYFEVDTPDLVVMDIDLPGISGIEGVWQLRQRWPDMKVLMLTVFDESEKIFGAIKAGANGYLLKKDSPETIINAISALLNGEAS
jgi:DNA-binding NarL/FixJ family response regulator